MKKLFALLLILSLLLTSCAAKQEETPAFTVPTPVIETPEPTPEPIPTEKPYSEFNERLKEVDTFVSPLINWATGPYSKLYSLTGESDMVALVYVEGREECFYIDDVGAPDGYSDVTVRLEKVWSGAFAQEGDTITVREPNYFIEYDDGTLGMPTNEDYYPMKEYAHYLIFLRQGSEDPNICYPTSVHYSKFAVNPLVDDLMQANTEQIHYKDLELAQSGHMEYSRIDPNLVLPDYMALFREVYETYYGDEAVQRVLAEERNYEKHYGSPEPTEWEAPPEGEEILWVCDTISPRMIFVPPTAENLGDGSLKEIHKQMNERGFNAEELLTLTPKRDAELWIGRYDWSPVTEEDSRFGYLQQVSLFTKDGEPIGNGDFGDALRNKELSEVVVSVTLRCDISLTDEPKETTNHYFFIVDLEDIHNSGWYD